MIPGRSISWKLKLCRLSPASVTSGRPGVRSSAIPTCPSHRRPATSTNASQGAGRAHCHSTCEHARSAILEPFLTSVCRRIETVAVHGWASASMRSTVKAHDVAWVRRRVRLTGARPLPRLGSRRLVVVRQRVAAAGQPSRSPPSRTQGHVSSGEQRSHQSLRTGRLQVARSRRCCPPLRQCRTGRRWTGSGATPWRTSGSRRSVPRRPTRGAARVGRNRLAANLKCPAREVSQSPWTSGLLRTELARLLAHECGCGCVGGLTRGGLKAVF